MMNQTSRSVLVGLCASLGALLTACSDAPPPAPTVAAQPPPPPAEPPKPTVTPIEQLMAELNIDPRVELPEEAAPATDEERRAVLTFFDGFARGNDQAVKGMLALTDQVELDALVDSGAWKDTVAQISKVAVQTGTHEAEKCALAVIEIGTGMNTSFQPQLWYYSLESEAPTFEAAPTPPAIMDQLSGGDWIAAWHKILADEAALAMEPDEPVEIAQRNVDSGEDRAGAVGASGGGGKGRMRDPGGPSRPPPDPGGPAGK